MAIRGVRDPEVEIDCVATIGEADPIRGFLRLPSTGKVGRFRLVDMPSGFDADEVQPAITVHRTDSRWSSVRCTVECADLPSGTPDDAGAAIWHLPPIDPLDDTRLDADEIYRRIGVYVVLFQHLENQLFQICWFLGEPSYSEVARLRLVNKGLPALIGETRRRVDAFLEADGRVDSDFARDFHSHLRECEAVNRERNRIVHSAYIHLEAGDELYGIVRSDMRKAKDGASVEFDQTHLTAEAFDAELAELSQVAWNVGFNLRQLTFWGPLPGGPQPLSAPSDRKRPE